MATCTGLKDPALALEQNLKCLATNLFDLVDKDDGVSLSNLSASISNVSIDTYNSSIYDTTPFNGSPEFTDFEYSTPISSESSGYLSSCSSNQFTGITSTPIPPPPPGFYQLPFRTGGNPVLVPQMTGFNAIQLPSAALLPINAGIPYVQAVMVPGIQTFPFVQTSLVGNNVREFSLRNNWHQSNSFSEGDQYEYSKRGMRRHSFLKKYPRRSEKDFMVVPQLDNNGLETTNEEIDLRKLKIGPDYLYQSEQTKLMNKFKKALSTLSDLANERRAVQTSVDKTQNDRSVSYDFNKNICGYQFSQYLNYILKIAKDEHKMAEAIIKELEASCSKFKTEFDGRGSVVLNEMFQKTNRLVQLEALVIIKGNELDVNRKPDEIKMVKDILDDFILSVRNVAVDMWCLKVWYQGLDCGQCKSSALI